MKMLLNGDWVDASDHGTRNVTNPATGKIN